jgi:hypothetical protein
VLHTAVTFAFHKILRISEVARQLLRILKTSLLRGIKEPSQNENYPQLYRVIIEPDN